MNKAVYDKKIESIVSPDQSQIAMLDWLDSRITAVENKQLSLNEAFDPNNRNFMFSGQGKSDVIFTKSFQKSTFKVQYYFEPTPAELEIKSNDQKIPDQFALSWLRRLLVQSGITVAIVLAFYSLLYGISPLFFVFAPLAIFIYLEERIKLAL